MKHIIKRERVVQFIAVDHFTVEAESVESAAEIANANDLSAKSFPSNSEIQFDFSILQDGSDQHITTRSIKVVDPANGNEVDVEQAYEEVS
jgi:hypothetical protein